MESIVSDGVHLRTVRDVHKRDSRRVDLQAPWVCKMTFQDKETYNWYLKGVESYAIILDASELPEKVKEVKFWWRLSPTSDRGKEYYAIGKVVIGNDLE